MAMFISRLVRCGYKAHKAIVLYDSIRDFGAEAIEEIACDIERSSQCGFSIIQIQ